MIPVLDYKPKEGTVEGVGLGQYVAAVFRGEIKPGDVIALLSSALAPKSGVACFEVVIPYQHKEYNPLDMTKRDWNSLMDNTFVRSANILRNRIAYLKKIAPEEAKSYI